MSALALLPASPALNLWRAAEATWNPAQHPRGRGGKFIKTIDRLIDAYHLFVAAGGAKTGPYPPGRHPFASFTRAQLMTGAKDRGLSVPRG